MRSPSAFEASVSIDRPAEKVFDFVAAVENRPRWQRGLLRVRKKTDGPDGLGTAWIDTIRFAGISVDFEMAYTEFEPNRTFVESASAPLLDAIIRLDFDGRGDRTRLTVAGEIDWRGIVKVGGRFLTAVFHKNVQRDLRKIKAIIEASQP